MPFITVKQGSRIYNLAWELVHQDKRIKRFKVWPVKNPDLFIVFENNEPLIRVQLGLKKRRIDWKQTEGRTMSQTTLGQIVKEIVSPTRPVKDIIYKGDTYNRKKKPDNPRRLGDR